MNANYALPAVNFFMADVGGGLGPFLSTWLAQVAHWSPPEIGWVIAAGSLTGAAFAGPAGSMVDRLGRPRLMLALACCLILAGTLVLLPARAFWLVMIAQMVVSAGGALGAPSISGLTLSIVGKKGYPKQQGTNEAANHTGNVAAAGLIALLSWGIGPMAAVAVLAVMAVSTLVTLWLMDPKAISADRMRGRKKRQKGEKRGLTRAVLKDRRLWILFAVIGTFQLGNSAMLPLLGQRIVQEGGAGATAWMSGCVIASSLTMIPVALAVGRMADRFGRRWLLIFACAVVIGRCALALFATGRYWLVPIEILDGIAAATFSVSAPLAIADLTYGSGRTQTAMGGMATVQAGGAALAGVAWGYAVQSIGFPATFGAMAVFPAIGIFLLFTIALKDESAQPEVVASGDGTGKAAAMSAAA
jgi:predicted MFS family arabinose efflux permease